MLDENEHLPMEILRTPMSSVLTISTYMDINCGKIRSRLVNAVNGVNLGQNDTTLGAKY